MELVFRHRGKYSGYRVEAPPVVLEKPITRHFARAVHLVMSVHGGWPGSIRCDRGRGFEVPLLDWYEFTADRKAQYDLHARLHALLPPESSLRRCYANQGLALTSRGLCPAHEETPIPLTVAVCEYTHSMRRGCAEELGPTARETQAWVAAFYASLKACSAEVQNALEQNWRGTSGLVEDVFYGRRKRLQCYVYNAIGVEEDLAIAAWRVFQHQHTGYAAPTPAYFAKAYAAHQHGYAFARALLKELFRSNKSLYRRTRKAAKDTELWPIALFEGEKAVMPKGFL